MLLHFIGILRIYGLKSKYISSRDIISTALFYNDLANIRNGTSVVSKATSATSAVYSSTANYAKSVAWDNVSSKPTYYAASLATSATYATNAGNSSKATSATSATYSSTANYAKAISLLYNFSTIDNSVFNYTIGTTKTFTCTFSNIAYYKLDNMNIISFNAKGSSSVISGACGTNINLSSLIRKPTHEIVAIPTNPQITLGSYHEPIIRLTTDANLILQGDSFYPFNGTTVQYTLIYFS
jgi:hypothetical protein